MKKLFFLAAAITVMASCADEKFLGEDPGTLSENATDGAIMFGLNVPATTRADIYGQSAAELLGNNFYVTGTKGTEADDSPSPTLVFDNYLVHWGANTAGTTQSNTANWEYVGIVPGTTTGCENNVKLSSLDRQTIKYWDYSAPQYDFLAFSTGTYAAVSGSSTASTNIGVTAMKYGTDLASSGVAYTFDLPSVSALKSTYITDITEVVKSNYGKEVQLQFKNLGSKVRIALYETVPGYSIQAGSVKFYTVDGTTGFTTDDKGTPANLISANTSSFASKGTVKVYFPNVGTDNHGNDNYDKAAATVTAGAGDTKKSFGNLATDKYVTAEGSETAGSLYLGRTLPTATFAGDKNAAFYETVFPVSTAYPLTLRVDYTLVPIDGAPETITVLGAKAVVPSAYTKWLPNYAYTYVFKISDNTNGWTDPAGVVDGLFPITFDAVVAEATDAQDEQSTITTVATPSITTYQQGHTYETNEYDNDGEKLYVQVMDNNLVPAVLVGTGSSSLYKLNTTTSESTSRSLLYALSDANATEAKVMDVLENQSEVDGGTGAITGRNSLVITPNTNIDNTVTSIEKGVDDNDITVAAGEAAEIAITALSAGTYAYVYDYTAAAKTTRDIYQPIITSTSSPIGANGKFYVAVSALSTYDVGIDSDASHYSTAGAPNAAYIYFSVTTNGGATKTYSFVSVDGKDAIPAGLLAYPVSSLTAVADNTANAADNTIYFDKYTRNNGKYAVKVIKVVD